MTPQEFYSANVQRWHHNPNGKLRLCGDNIRDHQERCVSLADEFAVIEEHLRNCIRWHDQPEVLLGDLSYTTKIEFKHLAFAWAKAEAEVIQRYNVPYPKTSWDRDVMKFVDRLDAYMTVKKYAPEELANQEWKEARQWLDEMCLKLKFDMEMLRKKVGELS